MQEQTSMMGHACLFCTEFATVLDLIVKLCLVSVELYK